jgi:ADP-ribose pyrophosphatase
VADPDPSGFRHLGDEEVCRLDRLRVVRGRFAAPDGSEFERDIVRNQAVVAMVPILPGGRSALLVRQYRGPIDDLLLEIPAGLCDVEGEDLEAAAARELVEEVGREAGHLERVAGWYPAAGFSDQYVHLYLATELTEVPLQRQGPEEEHMTVEEVALAEVPAMIADGRLSDSKTIIGLLLALRRLG